MPFDASLELHDGTAITADREATSTTRSGGSVSIDIGAGQAAYGSGLKDMAAVLIDPDGLGDTNDNVSVDIQGCATVDGVYVTIASFDDIGASSAASHDGSAASTQIIRFQVDPAYRYVRAYVNITDNSGSDFSEVFYILLCPYPYYVL